MKQRDSNPFGDIAGGQKPLEPQGGELKPPNVDKLIEEAKGKVELEPDCHNGAANNPHCDGVGKGLGIACASDCGCPRYAARNRK